MEREACNADCTKSVRCHLLKIENGECGNSCFESTKSSEGSSTSIGSATSSESKSMLDDDDVDDNDDDVVSSAFSLSSLSSEGPLFELSDLASELPIKRGLSRFYQGKSQSFTSLSKGRSVDDLAKKVTPFKRSRQKPPNKKKTCMTKNAGRATSTF